MQRRDTATDRGKRTEAEIYKFRRESVDVRRRSNKVEGSSSNRLPLRLTVADGNY